MFQLTPDSNNKVLFIDTNPYGWTFVGRKPHPILVANGRAYDNIDDLRLFDAMGTSMVRITNNLFELDFEKLFFKYERMNGYETRFDGWFYKPGEYSKIVDMQFDIRKLHPADRIKYMMASIKRRAELKNLVKQIFGD